jgi:cytochrome b
MTMTMMTIAPAAMIRGETMTDTMKHADPADLSGPVGSVRVWDPLLRVFHWGLVTAFAVAWLSADEVQPVHELAGYAVAGLIAFRLIWGFVGSRFARFAQFLRGPAVTLSYLGDMMRGRERRYIGHNPAGAVMVVALLLTLAGTALTGWLLEEPTRLSLVPELPQAVSPAFADGMDDHDRDDDEGMEALEDVHEALATFALVLVALHVGGVLLASFRHRENLARAMVTGTKHAPGPDDIA